MNSTKGYQPRERYITHYWFKNSNTVNILNTIYMSVQIESFSSRKITELWNIHLHKFFNFFVMML